MFDEPVLGELRTKDVYYSKRFMTYSQLTDFLNDRNEYNSISVAQVIPEKIMAPIDAPPEKQREVSTVVLLYTRKEPC